MNNSTRTFTITGTKKHLAAFAKRHGATVGALRDGTPCVQLTTPYASEVRPSAHIRSDASISIETIGGEWLNWTAAQLDLEVRGWSDDDAQRAMNRNAEARVEQAKRNMAQNGRVGHPIA